ncbi:MAG TPA: response regulator [Alphaproteobacteria bacterium]|nr:response regulator [Candidatus Acidoferrales bacterium]HUN30036.1 response regulator [Alphaproteobacteria bacterium]
MSGNDAVDVLLVEDNALDADMTIRAFTRHDDSKRITWVHDGEEAMAFLRESSPPRLVLLDLKMPKMNGFDLLRELRATLHGFAIPVVVLTSSIEDRDIAECYRLGANGFALKPMDMGDLDHVVEQIARYWLAVNRAPRLDGPI